MSDTKAKVFMGANDTFTVSDNGATMIGNLGSNTVKIAAGATGLKTDANFSRIELAGNLSDYKFGVIPGTGLQLQTAAGVAVDTLVSLNTDVTLAFANGSASLSQTGITAFTLGGLVISTTTPAAVGAALNTADLSSFGTASTTTAKVFMGANDTFTVSNSGATMIGNLGSNTVKIAAGATGLKTDANFSRIELAGNLSDYKFGVIPGTGLQLQTAAGVAVDTLVSLNTDVTMAFANGSASLSQTGITAFTLGGLAISTTTPAAVGATLNTADKSSFPTAGASTVTVSATGSSDASTGNITFNVHPTTSFTYNVAGFAAGDKLVFDAGTAITTMNSNSTDGIIDISGVLSGQSVTIHLTGIALAADGSIFNTASFNTVFGAGSLGSLGTVVPVVPGSFAVPISGANAGSNDATVGNVTYTIASATAPYTYSISGFAAGDKLVGPAGSVWAITNTSPTDGNITAQVQVGANLVTINLVGVAPASDANIFNQASFNTTFGAGSMDSSGSVTTPSAPTFTMTSNAVAGVPTAEGSSIVYTITPSGITDKAYSFTFSTVGSTLNGVANAAAANFFSPASQTVTFAAGTSAPQTVVQNIVPDSVVEGLRGYSSSLLNSSMTAVGNSITGLITDPIALATLSITGPASVSEGNTIADTVTLSAAQTTATTVSYYVAGTGGTVLGTDTGVTTVTGGTAVGTPTAAGGTISIPAGSLSATINVPITFDSVAETGKGVAVTLSAPSTGVALGTASVATLTPDNAPTFTMTSNAVAGTATQEGSYITYTITPSGITDKAYNFTLSTVGSTLNGVANAAAANFFSPASTVISFGAGSTTPVTITQYIVPDSVVEGLRGYSSSLLNSSLSAVASTTGLITDPIGKYYMSPSDSLTIGTSNATVFGSTGTETVSILTGVTGVNIDQNVERVNFPGASSSYTFRAIGSMLDVYDASGATLIAQVGEGGPNSMMGFSDGTVSAVMTGSSMMTLGGKQVSSTVPTTLSFVTMNISAAGTSNATVGNVTYTIASGTAPYTYNIAGFAAGDKLVFGTSASIQNMSSTDGIVDVSAVLSGNIVTIHLTGLALAADAGIFSATSFNTVFGAGSLA